jgi:hypothetical protein
VAVPPVLKPPKNPVRVAESETTPPGAIDVEERVVVTDVVVILTVRGSEPQELGGDGELLASPLYVACHWKEPVTLN